MTIHSCSSLQQNKQWTKINQLRKKKLKNSLWSTKFFPSTPKWLESRKTVKNLDWCQRSSHKRQLNRRDSIAKLFQTKLWVNKIILRWDNNREQTMEQSKVTVVSVVQQCLARQLLLWCHRIILMWEQGQLLHKCLPTILQDKDKELQWLAKKAVLPEMLVNLEAHLNCLWAHQWRNPKKVLEVEQDFFWISSLMSP